MKKEQLEKLREEILAANDSLHNVHKLLSKLYTSLNEMLLLAPEVVTTPIEPVADYDDSWNEIKEAVNRQDEEPKKKLFKKKK